MLFADAYRGKRVLITGNTGFKGSWLALWLNQLGAIVTGIGLPPKKNLSHWNLLKLPIKDYPLDIRNLDLLHQAFSESQPEIVFHLAAQSLVRYSYIDPLETWSTNVIGTANILEACRKQTSVRAIVVVTSDKCYENREWPRGYRENDRLGGHDPYSASKAGAELLVSSYQSSFFNTNQAPLLATARAGNVIGGGDWSEDRLIPDLIRALEKNESLGVRSPLATRPWQHVLESLSAYLVLGQNLLTGENVFAQSWNFGPELEGNRSVTQVLEQLKAQWKDILWHITDQPEPHEACLLYLDSTQARSKLGWHPIWNFEIGLEKTITWYRSWLENGDILSLQQLTEYVEAAGQAKIDWARV